MIRVGFILTFNDQGWIGGMNYYRSLFDAVMSLPDRKINPVIITNTTSDLSFLKDYPEIEIIRTKMLDEKSISFRIRFVTRKLLSYDLLFERLLKKYNICILSHSNHILIDASIPIIGWIPDFQHKHLPEFFSEDEIKARDEAFENICRLSSRIIFSSSNAMQDAERYYPEYRFKYEILHFVPATIDLAEIPDRISLQKRYPISEPYFLVPNQFWTHKNHRIIIEALKILHSQNRIVRVLCTGNTHDYRTPKYFDSLIKIVIQSDLSDYFIVLGIVPYQELIGLMVNSVSVINPSLFEGWSTTVEEAKSLGLPIILSDIPVHREQNPDGGVYFDPRDAKSLAEIMWTKWTFQDNIKPEEKMISKRSDFIRQKLEFGRGYEKIVLKTINF